MLSARSDDVDVGEATNSGATGYRALWLLSSVLDRDVEAPGRPRAAQAEAWRLAIGPN
jgi:hypothetical protein